ncbi:hypothetical protein ACN9ML_13450 [Dyadobacter endophyticus]|uniref:NIL domain-containing protein n=2 Tax=Dyadobacter TaxID=120831 RepID=A0ABQ1Z631_9BACT|nr:MULTISPECIES: hypothetical protein [Dyadobacter]GGH48899.1 hypothetical protein GCM10007423_50450 [Dyadobacter endophyticus]GGN03941.1 hypothetical protein GCM10010967_43500 [Dyadobacter beijingensis]
MKTYQLKLTYPETLSVHHITSLVESVKGVRIQRLNIIGRGREFVGVLVVEASGLLHYDSLVERIRSRQEVLLDEPEIAPL